MLGNTNTIINAHKRAKEILKPLFQNPDRLEFEILLQFLSYRSFSLFQCDPDLVSDFWYHINSEIVDEFGASYFNNFSVIREMRFKEYNPIYDALIMTGLMRYGQPSRDETESEIIGVWGLTVFPHVDEKTPLEIEKTIQFPNLCYQAHLIHMMGITGILDYDNDETKAIEKNGI